MFFMPEKVIYRNGRFEVIDEDEIRGFYTDKDGRIRPLTKRKKKIVRSVVNTSSESEMLNYVKSILKEYINVAGVKTNPKISVNNRWKRKIAHVRLIMSKRGILVGRPEFAINLDKIRSWYNIDPELADKAVRFSIAHEVAHLKQLEEYGKKMYYTGNPRNRVYLELIADKYAENLTGISSTDIAVIEEKLENTRLGIKLSVPIFMKEIDLNDISKLATYKNKIYARVVGYESGKHNRYIIPTRSITNIKMIPKSAKSIDIVVFDKKGNPIRSKKPITVSREELEKNFILTP